MATKKFEFIKNSFSPIEAGEFLSNLISENIKILNVRELRRWEHSGVKSDNEKKLKEKLAKLSSDIQNYILKANSSEKSVEIEAIIKLKIKEAK